MKSSATIVLGLLVVISLALEPALARQPRNHGKKEGVAAEGNQAGGQQKRQRKGAGAVQQQGGAMGGFGQGGQGSPQQVAQMMITTFDKDKDGALNQAELQAAVTALFQRMRTMMQQRGMGRGMMGQGMQGMGPGMMGPGMQQGMGQGSGMRNMNQHRHGGQGAGSGSGKRRGSR